MPLANGYGVLIGKVASYCMQSPNRDGTWPHYHFCVQAPRGDVQEAFYDCAIDLKSRDGNGIMSRDYRHLDVARFSAVCSLPDGWHPLASTPDSGALDVIRHPAFADELAGAQQGTSWWLENGWNAVKLIEYYFENVTRVFVFGAPYSTSPNEPAGALVQGVHDIHMNQGDPDPSQPPPGPLPVPNPPASVGPGHPPPDNPLKHWQDAGIWQDGGILFEYAPRTPDPELPPHLGALLTRFKTQALDTDDHGHPIKSF